MIPVVPVVPTPQPSARARDLADKMVQLVQVVREKETDLSWLETHQALELAKVRLRKELTGKGGNAATVILVVVLTALLVFFGVMASILYQSSSNRSIVWILMAGATASLLFAMIAIAARARRS